MLFEDRSPNKDNRDGKMKIGNADYTGNELILHGNPNGLPSVVGIIPCPFGDELERGIVFDKHLKAIIIRGYVILETKRVKNQAFDKNNNKTSLRVKYRSCKNAEEIHQVAKEISIILKSFDLNELAEYKVAIERIKVGNIPVGNTDWKVDVLEVIESSKEDIDPNDLCVKCGHEYHRHLTWSCTKDGCDCDGFKSIHRKEGNGD